MTSIRRYGVALAAIVALSGGALPASAQMHVFDPSNYSQNLLTAARTLEQVNNQILSLQNEAQMLINQARHLTSLPYSSLQQLQQIDRAFSTTYAPASANQSAQSLIANARTRWENSVAGLQDALRIQATVVGNLDTNRSELSALVDASQGAAGALEAAQAGNQLVALQAQQLADLTATVAAQGRAQSLEAAARVAAQDQAREQLRRFLAPNMGYQPSTVRMFHE